MQPMPLREPMRIAVRADLRGKIKVDPDPAVVKVGTPVQWHFVVSGIQAHTKLRWEVYFDHTNPFTWTVRSLETSGDAEQADQVGVVFGGEAQKPGDHKYGVRVFHSDSGESLGDDDPRLVVRP